MSESNFNNIVFITVVLIVVTIFILKKYQSIKLDKEQDPQKAWKKIYQMTRAYSESYSQGANKFPEKMPIKIPKVLEPYNIKYNPKTGRLIKPDNL